MINVSWNRVQDYIQWLNETLGLSGATSIGCPLKPNGNMPRGPELRPRISGATIGNVVMQMEITRAQNVTMAIPTKRHRLKATRAMLFGLYDTSGNVWEWVQDCYVTAMTAHQRLARRVRPSRGNPVRYDRCAAEALNYEPAFLRSANRYWSLPVVASSNDGFRLARTP